jgi:putative intracellular protease/amidase
MTGRVLIVVSGADKVALTNGKFYKTGFWLNELAEPLKHFFDAKMDADFTSPGGKKPSIDPNSLKMISGGKRDEYLKLVKEQELLWAPIPLENWQLPMLEEIAAIFIPGGHAPMADLWNNEALGRILPHFHKNNKPTIAICHGPAALLSTMGADGCMLYKNYEMTCFSNLEEQMVEHMGIVPGPVPFYVADELRSHGGIVRNRLISFMPHVVRDRELLTGQDPFAADRLGKEAVQMIRDWIGLQTPYLEKPYPW